MSRRGFTFIEMMLAVVLSAMLMAAVLTVLGGVARDRRILRSSQPARITEPLLAQLRWDLCNAKSIRQSGDGQSITLTGSGGLDPRTLARTGRLVAITYRCIPGAAEPALLREQQCLDDPTQVETFRELLAFNARSIVVTPLGMDAIAGDATMPVPSRVRVQIDLAGRAIDQEIWLK